MDTPTVFTAAVLLAATFIRSAVGFGEALIAVPLLALVMPVETAAPLAALASVTVAAIVVLQDWRSIHLRSAARLVLATLFGVPVGLLALTTLPEPVVKGSLGVIIATFSLLSLTGRRPARLEDDRLAWPFGFAAGVLGGAYGMNGPPLVMFGAMRGWTPQHFRATLQGYFLPASTMVITGYWMAGLWTPVVTRHYLAALPWVIGAVFAGRWLNSRMEGGRFLQAVYLLLVGTGVLLLSQAFSFV